VFRHAIEACDRSALPITFENFPAGSCGDAALILGKYLEERGFGLFDYVLGERGGRSHAWLQRGHLVVDITGDQFDDMSVAKDAPYRSGKCDWLKIKCAQWREENKDRGEMFGQGRA